MNHMGFVSLYSGGGYDIPLFAVSPLRRKLEPCACPDKAQCDEAGECLKAMGVFK